MKIRKLLLVVLLLSFNASLFAQTEQTDTIKVYGSCGMCKTRIEKNLMIDGITTAVWEVATNMLTVTYDSAVISNEAIQKIMAAAGHDTEKFTAPDEVYKKLPGCCKYERRKQKE